MASTHEDLATDARATLATIDAAAETARIAAVLVGVAALVVIAVVVVRTAR